MTAPRLEISLLKIQQNARKLVVCLADRGISVVGVTKATVGSPEVARALLGAGVCTIGDSRIENIEAMRHGGVAAPMVLIRTPMLSQADRVVASADVSFNSELDVISQLSSAAQRAKRRHGVVLMLELGDLREGVMPEDIEDIARQTLRFPNIVLLGIGANLACRSGISPDAKNMSELSALVGAVEVKLGVRLSTVSGGNSANLNWALSGAGTGRINQLRLGESILLGREALYRRPILDLHTDAFTLVTEVIESKVKPSLPWGKTAQNAFGNADISRDRGLIAQSMVAVGRQDIDPEGLTPASGIRVLGASSDHLILDSGRDRLPIGTEVAFQLNYSALLRAMTSPFVSKVFKPAQVGISRSGFQVPSAINDRGFREVPQWEPSEGRQQL